MDHFLATFQKKHQGKTPDGDTKEKRKRYEMEKRKQELSLKKAS